VCLVQCTLQDLMTVNVQELAGLACPRCAGPLEQENGLGCGQCEAAYSFVGSVPCLMPDASLWRARSVQRLDEYLELSAGRLADLELELEEAPGLLARTRTRLGRIAEALKVERALIASVMAPLRSGAIVLPTPAPFTEEPTAGTLDLFSCYEHVFRDWSWGEAESQAAIRLLRQLVARSQSELSLQSVAVLGAGAGRLAADVHCQLGPARTYALDVNPLPLLIAERLVRGDVLHAREFPVAPRSENEVVVARQLRCPFSVPDGLTLLFADALSPPFAEGALSAVVTPWFIDAVGADPRVTAAAIHRVLEPGGLWLNFGPLRFNGPTSRLYMIEEVIEIVTSSGFEVCAQLREQLPYFASPESGLERRELVYGFAARKVGEAEALFVPSTEPAWVLDANEPVPALSLWSGVRKSAGLADGLLGMVDGHRSIAEIADVLGPSWGVAPRTLDSHLQAYLSRFLPR